MNRPLVVSALIARVVVCGAQDAPKAPVAEVVVSRVSSSTTGRLIGVYDEQTGFPVRDADITDLLGGGSVQTSSTGTAALRFVRSRHDSAVVRVRRFGYRDTTILAMVGLADSLPITLTLDRMYELPEVLTTALAHQTNAMREFQQHQLLGMGGKFLTPEDLNKEPDDRLLADVLAAHGVTAGCQYIYLDGLKINSPMGVPAAGDFEAIEMYESTASAPIGYDRKTRPASAPGQDAARCGVILLWSRQQR
jgi:hypothetical protein